VDFKNLKGAYRMSTTTFSERGVKAGHDEYSEGTLAKMIEEQTAKLPSDVFLWAACGSMVTSLAFQVVGDHRKATFFGQWAPTLLILGLYNKLVKLHGSD
jgi:hypothetical protein